MCFLPSNGIYVFEGLFKHSGIRLFNLAHKIRKDEENLSGMESRGAMRRAE
jgi:hypothetical protein